MLEFFCSGLVFLALFQEKTRKILRKLGLCVAALGLLGVLVLTFSSPGRESVEEEERRDRDPDAQLDLTFEENLASLGVRKKVAIGLSLVY